MGRGLLMALALLVAGCATPYRELGPHPTREQIQALARAGMAQAPAPQEAAFSLRFWPPIVLAGQASWMTCHVPPSLEARRVRMEVAGWVTERPAHLHRPRMIERVPCGRHEGVCTVRDAAGRQHRRTAALTALGECMGARP